MRLIFTEYMIFISVDIIKPPCNFNEDVEHKVNSTMNNLTKFA